jgi:HEAT repeat protein
MFPKRQEFYASTPGDDLMRTFGKCLFTIALCLSGSAARADAVDDLIAQLKDRDSDMRRGAAKRLAEMGADAKKAGPALVAAVKNDRDLFVRRFAAQALGAVGADPKTAVPPLAALLKEDSKELTEAAITSLGKMGADGVSALVEVVKKKDTSKKDKNPKKGPVTPDRSAFLRAKAVAALGEIGPEAKAAVPALIDALKDASIRADVATALGNMGSAAKDAVPALREALTGKGNKRDRAFRDAVNQAIRKIEKG